MLLIASADMARPNRCPGNSVATGKPHDEACASRSNAFGRDRMPRAAWRPTVACSISPAFGGVVEGDDERAVDLHAIETRRLR